MPADLPDTLQDLVGDLVAMGLGVTSDVTDDESFGNRVLELHRPDGDPAVAVRLVEDRGLWSTDVLVGGEWLDARQVEHALDDAPYAARAQSHAERRATVLAVVDRLAGEPVDADVVRRRVTAQNEAYARERGWTAD